MRRSACARSIAWVGAVRDAAARRGATHDARRAAALGTPGLVDCHTHLVYAGNRADEFERASTARRTRKSRARAAASWRPCARRARRARTSSRAAPRAAAGRAGDEGVTTVEIKSGYGLDTANELKQLRVARALGAALDVDVRTTLLAAHALPPEFAGAPTPTSTTCATTRFLRRRATGLADAVDAFCETIGFTPAQTRRVFEAARAQGCRVKLHADQLSDSGGARSPPNSARCRPTISSTRATPASRRWRARHGRRAAAGRVLRAARDAAAAGRRVARATACRSRSRPTAIPARRRRRRCR